jgi:endonuclease YncB( thermonuclease family)
MSKKFFICLLLLIFSCPEALAHPMRVVAISDGNTITIEPTQGGDRAKVSLHGINAPELGQQHGKSAQGFVTDLTLSQVVDVQITFQSREISVLTKVIVEIPGQGILQELLLESGWAWVYPEQCKDDFCNKWLLLEAEARAERKGLWGADKPVPPWVWRKQKP